MQKRTSPIPTSPAWKTTPASGKGSAVRRGTKGTPSGPKTPDVGCSGNAAGGFGEVETLLETARSLNKVVSELNTLALRVVPLTQHTGEVENLLRLANQRLEVLKDAAESSADTSKGLRARLLATKPNKEVMESLESGLLLSSQNICSILSELYISALSLVQRYLSIGRGVDPLDSEVERRDLQDGDAFEANRQYMMKLSQEVSTEVETLESIYKSLKEYRVAAGDQRSSRLQVSPR